MQEQQQIPFGNDNKSRYTNTYVALVVGFRAALVNVGAAVVRGGAVVVAARLGRGGLRGRLPG